MKNIVLLIIDVQEGFADNKWGERNNPQAEKNISVLLNVWRTKGLPVIHIQHLSKEKDSPFHPENGGIDFKEIVKPIAGERVFQKSVNSAFIGTGLEAYLRSNRMGTVVITGLTTPHCISTTARMSGNLGFDTYLVSDATAAFELQGPDNSYYSAEEVHSFALTALHNEFAYVLTTDEMRRKLDDGQIA